MAPVRSEPDPTPTPSRALWPSDRICDAATAGFAVWTLCCHAVVAAGGSLHTLLILFAGAGTGVLALGAWLGARGPAPGKSREAEPRPQHEPAWTMPLTPRVQDGLQAGGLALAASVVGASWLLGGVAGFQLFWIASVALLTVASVAFVLTRPLPAVALPAGAAAVDRRSELVLWTLAVVCVLLTALAHRPDLDDAFYVNVAVAVAGAPGAALLAGDTLHGLPDVPLHLAVYRLHSYELGNGALAYLLGVPAIAIFHFVSASLAAALVPLAHARVFREICPRVWPWAVAALVVVLLGWGETHRSYGNFAFVRLWQGKAVALFVFLPLIYAYAIRFARRPSGSRFALLAAAQIAAIGCSSSALWFAPVAALTGLASVLQPTRRGLVWLGVGALASLYGIVVGAALQGAVQAAIVPPVTEPIAPVSYLASALAAVLGQQQLLWLGMFVTTGAWAVCARDLSQRFAIMVPLAVLLVLLNPWLTGWVSHNVTGPSYWRAVWGLPLPILISLVLVSPLHLAHGQASTHVARVVAVGLAVVFVFAVSAQPAWSPDNDGNLGVGMRLGAPALKVPEPAYRVAALLNESVPAGSVVLAPVEISPWLATFERRSYPLQVRHYYLRGIEIRFGERDVTLRQALTLWVGGKPVEADMPTLLVKAIDHYGIAGVCLRESPLAPAARRVLESSGFTLHERVADYEIWIATGRTGEGSGRAPADARLHSGS